MKIIKLAVLAVLLAASSAHSQTNVQFTGIKVTDEGAIQLHWSSRSNEIYEIDEADSLNNTNVTWNKLYDDYPSQGTNTFIGDFGNYNLSPQIFNPKDMPIRFYRLVDKGQDPLASDEPSISITSPTNGSAVSDELTITVVAASDQPVISGTKLYVDGQEMRPANVVTNYSNGSTNYEADTYNINTCEWGNEAHTLFATATCHSGFGGGPLGAPAVLTGNAVSSFVQVTFSNLISRISFSQPFFQPELGQTQQVSAVFSTNCDWTLNIVDVSSNVVQTASGSGTSMLYDWDGTSNGTNIPNGIYYYYIYAETNGEADEIVTNDSGGGGGSPPSPDFAFSSSSISDAPQLWAMPTNGLGDAAPLILYPPGFDTNSLMIFSATPSEMRTASALASLNDSAADDSGRFSPDASSSGSSAASQGSSAAPQRPPPDPIKGSSGTFGIAYQTYSANGTNGYRPPLPRDNNVGLNSFVSMENMGTVAPPYGPLTDADTEGILFATEMQKMGWSLGLFKSDDSLRMIDLQGNGPFNQVDIGLLILHCAYGTSNDSTPGHPVKQMYFPITFGTGSSYLRMSDMDFGGITPTNGLKWMALAACSSLYHVNWSSMNSQSVKPYNSNLHLLLGADTVIDIQSRIGEYWAAYMLGDTNITPVNRGIETIRQAWYDAFHDAYQEEGGAHTVSPMKLVIAGDNACLGDYLQTQTNTVLSGSWQELTAVTIYPP